MTPSSSLPDDFSHLEPEHFLQETSATETLPIPGSTTGQGLHRGPVGFRLFVTRCLERASERVIAGEFGAHATMANSRFARWFLGEPDELPDHFANRLRREAKLMGAIWLFVVSVAPFRVTEPGQDNPMIDPDDQLAVAAAIEHGDFQEGLCWTACSKETNTRQNLQYEGGVVYLDENGCPYRQVAGTVVPQSDPYHFVLSED